MQRVPTTEKRGRRHSSQVTVVVVDPDTSPTLAPLRDSEIRTDFFRASGAGGQHRNKVSSAVRLTHLPTGLVVTATEERSQHQNLQVARARLTTALRNQADSAIQRHTDALKAAQFSDQRNWTWTAWRDQVKGPGGRRQSMTRALAGALDPLL